MQRVHVLYPIDTRCGCRFKVLDALRGTVVAPTSLLRYHGNAPFGDFLSLKD